jgi:hypothetical protein
MRMQKETEKASRSWTVKIARINRLSIVMLGALLAAATTVEGASLAAPPENGVLLAQAAPTSAAAPGTAEPEPHQMSASDLNQQITNPVGNVWSLQSQFQNFKLSNGQWNNVWNFQPALPISLTKDWNLITRTVLPFYNIVPHETAPGEFKRTAGFGDITLNEIFSPAHAGNWLLGAGPTFIFPTASSTFTGQGKVALGPVGLVGYMTKDFILGVFPQQWFAVSGSPSRPYTSNLNLQPIATMFFGDGWDVGYSGNILANWRAPSGDVWTVPVGLNIGKVVKFGPLPVKLQFAGQYMPVHPNSGPKYNLQLQITPVIPKLFKGTLFE